MIHGGGHVMLSRKDIRPAQTRTLLDAGFLPISIDYRLCPELTLLEGPMRDVRDALKWARSTLPSLRLQRGDIRPNGDKVVAIGWSTGGHLAMTLAFTSLPNQIEPPQAILAFYCPSDYEDQFWTRPNVPRGTKPKALEYDVMEGVNESPITGYNISAGTRALGGWMNPSDRRSRIALHMNWKGQTLPVLLNGLTRGETDPQNLPAPTKQQVQSISPLAQIRAGRYKTPTFIVHGTQDDLIPWEQAQRTYEGLIEAEVQAEARIVQGGVHLFDVYDGYEEDEGLKRAVRQGYEFLRGHVGP
ncbi:hypothetical protein MMC07_001440 [Pseudocyphellaria aurata]|nr:hypothetical protein [Pseudocyphellaria aurata]